MFNRPIVKVFLTFFKKTIDFFLICIIIATVVSEYNKSKTDYAPLAQLVEHLTLNQGVQGSSP